MGTKAPKRTVSRRSGGKRRQTGRVGAYRSSTRWAVRDGIVLGSARALVADWLPGATIVALSKGDLGLADVLEALIEQAGAGCSVLVSSWALGVREVRRLAALARQDSIGQLRILCDASILGRAPAEVATLRTFCGPNVLRLGVTHAKVGIVRHRGYVRAVLSSANLNSALRLESYVITDDSNVAQYLEQVLESLHASALDDGAAVSEHRRAFENWRAEEACPSNRPARGRPDDYLSDDPLGVDVRRAGLAFL